MHLDGSSATSLRCLLYNNGPVTKDIGTIRMAISSAQGTLRATAQLDLYLYLGGNDIDPFSLNFFLFFFGGFLVGMSKGYFHFNTQTSCVHAPLPLHFFLPTFHQHLDP
jgi:hypothetical protein